ncbi:MAG: iron-sulfur cluster assembly accessory protein [Myxococcota bacterium]|nr:iron-sulfur cluster assembly accessory protein [Myxococcota bacterium]
MAAGSDAKAPNLVSMPADWTVAREGQDPPAVDPIIHLTEAARVEVRKLIEAEGKPGLRLGIKGGGCSGLSYLLEFTEEREGDTVINYDEFRVFLDRKSTIYLRDITLDHQGGLDGRGFVFHNPQASNTCGCGESFSL